MPLYLHLPSLRSRTTAVTIKAKRVAGNVTKKVGGVLQKIARFGGWLFGQIVRFFNLDFDRLWDIIVEGYFALKFFDWNATDAELQKQIEANNQRIANAAGDALGTALGWGTVRLANFFLGRFLGSKSKQTAAKIKVPVLSARIGLALAEEGNEEITQMVRQFLNVTATAQIGNAFINFVLTARRNEWFGMSQVTKPQSNGSINAKIEEKIEKLPKFWQQPVENLIESFEDAIIEAGYVISYTIDDYVSAMKYARDNEYQRTIEVKPNPASEEKLTIAGGQSEVKEVLQHTLYSTYPLIENRDIGEYFGAPINEQIKLEPQLRTLQLQFCEYEKPPFSRKGKLGKRVTLSIPDARPGITWTELKNFVPKYISGSVWVTAKFENGRQIQGWFLSGKEGEETLTKLANLSNKKLDINSFRFSVGNNSPTYRKPKMVYPVRAALVFPKNHLGDRGGLVGNAQRMDLWTDTEPKDTKPFK